MKNPIEKLKEEHRQLTEEFDRVKKVKPFSEEGKKAIMELRNYLLSHLRHEEEWLYPDLEKAGQDNPVIKETIAPFKGIKNLIPRIKEILEEYALDMGTYNSPACDVFEILSTDFSIRFKREEAILYRLCMDRCVS